MSKPVTTKDAEFYHLVTIAAVVIVIIVLGLALRHLHDEQMESMEEIKTMLREREENE